MKYGILYNPGHNRVYFETSMQLSISEFAIVAQQLSTEYAKLQQETIHGIAYLTFETVEALADQDIAILSELSFVYALFQIEEQGGTYRFTPISKTNTVFVDESISTILKYSGKTNEIFTRMLINLAVYSRTGGDKVQHPSLDHREALSMLDPVAGKGTTLFECLIKGYHVYGIEISDTVVREAQQFLRKYLETAKYKFQYKSIRLSGPQRAFTAVRHTIVTAKTKEEEKNKNTRTVEFIAGNAQYADQYYKKGFFDVIVGDLPYGVQHSNVSREKQSSMTRNPSELLAVCLPAWLEVLKKNGVIALAWNQHVLPRQEMEQLLSDHGFVVNRDSAYLDFAHRVDQSILRDVVVAHKP